MDQSERAQSSGKTAVEKHSEKTAVLWRENVTMQSLKIPVHKVQEALQRRQGMSKLQEQVLADHDERKVEREKLHSVLEYQAHQEQSRLRKAHEKAAEARAAGRKRQKTAKQIRRQPQPMDIDYVAQSEDRLPPPPKPPSKKQQYFTLQNNNIVPPPPPRTSMMKQHRHPRLK